MCKYVMSYYLQNTYMILQMAGKILAIYLFIWYKTFFKKQTKTQNQWNQALHKKQ